MARFPTFGSSYVAALFAVALLSLAGVRSTLMQVEMAAVTSAPDCGMAGMDMGSGRPDSHRPDAMQKNCAFCAAAGHLPICTSVEPHRSPSTLA